jgi:histidinol-phosphate aminotransferase
MPDTLRYVRDGRNVVTLRTFSKIHGLASLRVGYGIAPPELIEGDAQNQTTLQCQRSRSGRRACCAGRRRASARNKKVVDEGRAFFEKEFRAMKLSFVPSAANFVLVKVGDGLAVFRALLQRKVIVRAMKGYNLPEWIRITIGTMDQNQKCITALRQVLGL